MMSFNDKLIPKLMARILLCPAETKYSGNIFDFLRVSKENTTSRFTFKTNVNIQI